MSHASFCNTVQTGARSIACALDNTQDRAVLVQQRDSPWLCCERPQACSTAVQLIWHIVQADCLYSALSID